MLERRGYQNMRTPHSQPREGDWMPSAVYCTGSGTCFGCSLNSCIPSVVSPKDLMSIVRSTAVLQSIGEELVVLETKEKYHLQKILNVYALMIS